MANLAAAGPGQLTYSNWLYSQYGGIYSITVSTVLHVYLLTRGRSEFSHKARPLVMNTIISWHNVKLASSPGPFEKSEKRAWYPLFAHALKVAGI